MRNREPPPLNAEIREIIGAARGAHEPSELSRARVRKGVELKLAAGLGLVLAPASTAFAGAAKVTLIVAAVGTVVGTGIYVLPRHAPAPAAAPTRAHVRAVAREIPAPPLPDERPAPVVVNSPAPAPRRRQHAPTPAAVDNVSALTEETQLLGSANAALARRDVAGALALLEDYDRRGGAAILGEERTVTGILALCASGRADAARAEARHFRARWPKSPLAARVDGSCVGAARPTP